MTNARHADRRTAFTLLELLLALVVLTAAMAVVWPSVERLYHQQALKQAAEHVRAKLTGARIRALDFGVRYQFRYEPRGRRFLVIPYQRHNLQASRGRTGRASSSGEIILPKFSGLLPEGMRFENFDGEETEPQGIAASWLTELPDSQQLAATAWSRPLLFRSDGTATDAAFHIVDANQQSVLFWVRGLTGGVTVSRVEPEAGS